MSTDKSAPRTPSSVLEPVSPASASSSPPDPEHAPILVVGTGRSGTTLLRLMLNAHSRIYLTHEASFYLYRSRLLRDLSGDDWLDHYLASPSFAWLQLDPERVRAGLPTPLRSDEIKRAMVRIMHLKAESYGKPRYGDKTPFHTRFLRMVFDDFPSARVIHIVRSPRHTIESLIRMPWAPASPGLSILLYRDRLREIEPFRDRIYEIRLEDLIEAPRKTMSGVLEFIGEPWEDRVLDHSRFAPSGDMPPFPWLQSARRAVRVEERPLSLSPAWVRIIEHETAVYMDRYGYLPEPLDREPSALDRLLARARDIPVAVGSIWRMLRVFLSLRTKPAETIQLLNSIDPSAWQYYPDFELPDSPSVGDKP